MEKTIVVHKTPVKQLGSALHNAMNSVVDVSDVVSGPFMEYQAMLRLDGGSVISRELNRDADNFIGHVVWTYEDGIGEGAPAEGYYGRLESGFDLTTIAATSELGTLLPAKAINTPLNGVVETVDIEFSSEGGSLIDTAFFSLANNALKCFVSIRARKRGTAPVLLKATTDTRGYFVRLLFDKPVNSLFAWIGTDPDVFEAGYFFEQHLLSSTIVDVPMDPEVRLMDHGEDYYLILSAAEAIDYGLFMGGIADAPIPITNLIREAPLVTEATVSPDGKSMTIYFDRNMGPPQAASHLGLQIVVGGVYRPAAELLPYPTSRRDALILNGIDPVIQSGNVVTLNRFAESLVYPIMSSGGGLLGSFEGFEVVNNSTIAL